MNVVFVKHDGCPTNFLFEVPKGEEVFKGDMVKVDTKYGVTLGTCTSNSFEILKGSDTFKAFKDALGVKEPLKKVLGVYSYRDLTK